MVKCPLCKGELVRYAFRTRMGGMRIAVECEACGHVGPEFVLAHMNDTSAALSAARAFSSPSAARRFLLPAPSTMQ